MKQKHKTTFTLHRRFRRIGPHGGSARWHVEELDVPDAIVNDRGHNTSDVDLSYDEEVDRENRRKVDEVTREGEDRFGEAKL